MQVQNMKQKSVGVHDFAMNPRAQVMRSSFGIRQPIKTAFSASYLVPIWQTEVLPGDSFNLNLAAVVRTAVPIVPILDNWHMEFFAFFTPWRILWTNFQKFMGAQDNPGDSTAFTLPTVTSPSGGYAVGSLMDYMGLPTSGQVLGGNTITHSNMAGRAYNRIFNEWFRDQNLTNSVSINVGDGPDSSTNYTLQTRSKRPDYFTMCLPWPQKGTAITLPLGSTANVITQVAEHHSTTPGLPALQMRRTDTFNKPATNQYMGGDPVSTGTSTSGGVWLATGGATIYPTNLYADLSTAVGPTVNLFRQYFQTQKFMERQARGGTRYAEVIYSHYGVRPPDYRLDRPEYCGGGHIPIITNAIPQTSATGLTGGTTPAGNLAATGYAQGNVTINYTSQEHGTLIIIANVRADINYQQGMHRSWKRSTVLDIFFPVFSMLGEQDVKNSEIYCDGSANDSLAFGYIPRWDKYRHFPGIVTGIFRSTAAGTLDYWHSTPKFTALPTLNDTFIKDSSRTVLERNFSAGAATQGQQFLCDFMLSGRAVRPLPVNSVPGMIDHF